MWSTMHGITAREGAACDARRQHGKVGRHTPPKAHPQRVDGPSNRSTVPEFVMGGPCDER